jgi:septum formation protein
MDPGEVEEYFLDDPREMVVDNAVRKATSVALRLEEGLVIGADTVILLGEKRFGKARNRDEAMMMLRSLSGSSHHVLTGLAIYQAGSGRLEATLEETKVIMRSLSCHEIRSYIDSGEPIGKAGGYAIQGLGAVLVDSIEGVFSNVVGIPLPALYIVLKKFGYDIFKEKDDRR